MKNLDFLLKVLSKVRGSLELSIVGPKEDLKYWKKCVELIKKLPSNIKIHIGKEIAPNKVQKKFKIMIYLCSYKRRKFWSYSSGMFICRDTNIIEQ